MQMATLGVKTDDTKTALTYAELALENIFKQYFKSTDMFGNVG